MIDIVALLQCTSPYLNDTASRQLGRIITALLSMTGRVTMLGISRWAGRGGSYRTVQRFFYTTIPWATVFWLFFRQHLLRQADSYLLAGDETIVTKSGKQSYGLDRFFSSLYGKAVPGLSFMVLSLVSLTERRSYPLMVEQLVRSEADKASSQAKKLKPAAKDKPKGKPGRPKGSKNKDKTQVELTPELALLQRMMSKQMALIDSFISVVYI